MKVRSIVFGSIISAGLVAAGYTLAEPPKTTTPTQHPTLDAAQRLTVQAYDKIIAAQQANEWDMEGHASKAEGYLDQANQELKLAAEAASKPK